MTEEYGCLIYGSLNQAETKVRQTPLTQEHLNDCKRHNETFNCRRSLPCGFPNYVRGNSISCDTCACGYDMVISDDYQTSSVWLCKMDYLSSEDHKRLRE